MVDHYNLGHDITKQIRTLHILITVIEGRTQHNTGTNNTAQVITKQRITALAL